MISCEISFIPVESDDCAAHVGRVLEIIAAAGLEYTIGPMSTCIRGEAARVFALLAGIHSAMDGVCKFVIDLRISNLCGCGKNA